MALLAAMVASESGGYQSSVSCGTRGHPVDGTRATDGSAAGVVEVAVAMGAVVSGGANTTSIAVDTGPVATLEALTAFSSATSCCNMRIKATMEAVVTTPSSADVSATAAGCRVVAAEGADISAGAGTVNGTDALLGGEAASSSPITVTPLVNGAAMAGEGTTTVAGRVVPVVTASGVVVGDTACAMAARRERVLSRERESAISTDEDRGTRITPPL